MESRCPICGNLVEGDLITKKESSLLKSCYRLSISMLVPLPFVGSYLGGKLADFVNSLTNKSYKHICHKCKCHWTDSPDTTDIKVSGNNKLMAIYYSENMFVVGSIENNIYTIQTKLGNDIETIVVSKQNNIVVQTRYINGLNNERGLSYGAIEYDGGLYIGEFQNSKPNGWGLTYAKNGYLYYGKWSQGQKHGIMLSVSFDGQTNNVMYWKDGVVLE